MAELTGVERTRPADDECEVTVLGPGYGESIVVHLGYGRWLVVDSCLDQTRQPAALTYLSGIGVAPSSVVLVVASHWHDDHIRGLAAVVETCVNAKFSCSMALSSKEFLHLVSADGLSQTSMGSGVAEFKRIVDVLKARNPLEAPRVPKFAAADTVLWEDRNAPFRAAAFALSPSSAATVSALQIISQLVPTVTSKRHRIPKLQPNDTSVAIVVEMGADAALLGADLETTRNPDTGWNGVFENAIKPNPSAIYKVAHHGSHNGHHDRIYSDLLLAGPTCVLTPFRSGNVSLPRDSDIARIISSSGGELYSTAVGRGPKANRDRAVARTLKEMRVSVEPVDPVYGVVQMRRVGNNPWKIGLSEAAAQLH